jgi:SAM-dependent methyltransferase
VVPGPSNRRTISLFGTQEYGFAQCDRCLTRFAVPWDDGDLDYEDIQRNHYGYALHQADHAYVSTLLGQGPEPFWARLAAQHLAGGSADRRYVHALGLCLRAFDESRHLDVLEVGCNLGHLGGVLARLGHAYRGLDVQSEAIRSATLAYGPWYTCGSLEEQAADERYDLVLAFDVIEHLLQPRQFLLACLERLRPGGRLIITTPDGDAMPRGAWTGDLPPLHLAILCRRAFTVAFPDGGGYQLTMWNEISAADPLHRWHAILRPAGPYPGEAAIPQVDPSHPKYKYAGRNLDWRPTVGRRRAEWQRRALALARGVTSFVLGEPIEGTLVVEVQRLL